jgi:hypothetical protein
MVLSVEIYAPRTDLLINSMAIQSDATSLPIWIIVSSITKALSDIDPEAFKSCNDH